MKKTIATILLFFLIKCIAIAQCPDTLYVTQPGNSYLYGEFPDEQLRIYFYNQSGSLEDIAISFKPNEPSNVRRFILWNDDDVGNFGTYRVTSENGFECSGVFVLFYPEEYLTFDPCHTTHTGANWSYGCSPAYGRSHMAWFSCLGDTSVMTITNKEGIATKDYPPITYDRVIIDNAEIISLTDDTLKVVWNKASGSCFRFKGINKYGFEYQSFRTHYVRTNHEIRLFDSNENESIEICSEQSVSLFAESVYNIDPIWEVSDGRVFYGYQNEIRFDIPGTYTVTVKHRTDECNCIKDGIYTVVVKTGDTPTIECKQTVCLGESTTYYSGNECDSYLWDVGSGGVIVEGGSIEDSYVTVEWNSGPTNNISLSTPNCFEETCESSVTETISVINPSIEILGPIEVCQGSFAIYTAPEFTGTNFNWGVSEGGDIENGQGSNTVRVYWSSFPDGPNQKIWVSYNNCNIDCNGYAELEVLSLPRLSFFSGENTICKNTEYSVFSYPRELKLDWEVIAMDGSILSLPRDSFATINISVPGDYYIKAINPTNSTCNLTDSVLITIAPDINPPGIIDGPEIICVGTAVKYSIPSLTPIQTVLWEVNDGTGTFVNKGSSRELIQIWTSNGPYEIRAIIRDGITGCESQPTIFSLNSSSSITGNSEVCLGEQVQYALPDYNGINKIIWEVSPASAGTIIESQDDWTKVIWNTEGSHKIFAFYCGVSLDIATTVHNFPSMTVAYDDYVCFNESSLVNISTDNANNIRIKNESNVLVSTSNSPSLDAGKYTIEVSSPFGCTISEEIEITEGPELSLEIDSNHGLGVCPPFTPFELFVREVSSNYSYQWYKDNQPVGTNSPSFMADEVADYYVVVTDKEGCQATSNILILFACCSGGVIDPVDVPNVAIDVTDESCNTKQFEVIPPYVSTNFSWNFGDPKSGSNSASGFNVEHTFSRAGTYIVTASGNALCETVSVDVCGQIIEAQVCEGGLTVVEVPLVADYDFLPACDGEEVTFIDRTTKLPSVGSVNYIWDFDDPGSGSNNTSTATTPTHVFSSSGSYSVTLTVTKPGVCSSTKSYIINVAPGPTVLLTGKAEDCLGLVSFFTSELTGNIIKRRWNFGDPGSGTNNFSAGSTGSHVFSSFGIFTVTLVVTDINGCTSSATHIIDISDNTIIGEISSDIASPKCPEDIITLTAPSGSYTYLWSNGETTSSITVTEPNTYTVTISDSSGCDYVPNPFPVYNYDVSGTQIYAFDEASQTYVFDSITVCLGQEYNILATNLPNAIYTWSPITNHTSLIEYEDHFKNLPAGRYTYYVTIMDTIGGCSVEDGPFVVNVLDQLQIPSIVSEGGQNCENNPITLSVVPYSSENTYEWSNGLSGESINVFSSGQYTVKVTNEIGCSETSASFIINPAPGTNEWMTGCMEVCFPREFCINLNNSNGYQLVHNGNIIGSVNSSFSTLDITAPGDYQLLVTNQYGCQSMSDLLSLSATPDDQTLEGIVFLDDNENRIFDGSDALQVAVTVYLMNGTTIIETTTTDVNGYYQFDPVPQSNLRVVLDPESVNFIYEGDADSTLIYFDCIEDKIVDFPLISTCGIHLKIDTLYTCPDIPISIDGVMYNVNESDTVRVNLYEKCDSLYVRNVLGYADPVFDFSLTPRCQSEANGLIEIDNLSDENLTFSLTQNFEVEDTQFVNLDVGVYTLFVKNDQGCLYEFPFEILQVPIPEISVTTDQICIGDNNGLLTIDVVSGDQLLFSMHQDSIFTAQQAFSGLSEGSHTVFIQDTLGCIYTEEINISAYLQPAFDTEISQACEGQDNGSLTVNIQQGNPQFSLDENGSFGVDTYWENIDEGTHTLYVMSQFGCLDSIEIIVNVIPVPTMEFEILNGCENINLGELYITGNTENLLLSIDGSDFSSTTNFNGLEAGSYILYSQTIDGCIFESPFDIEEYEEPSLSLNPFQTCQGVNEGQLIISDIAGADLRFSTDGTSFQEDSLFNNLPSGDYSLYVQVSNSDCNYQYPFTIEQIEVPEIVAMADGSCEGLEEGAISISVIEGDGLTYDIDGDGVFVSDTEYQNLPSGAYSIMIMDTFGCIYEEFVEIEVYQNAEFSVDTKGSCDGQVNGSLSISLLSGNATFAIGEPTNFTLEPEYLNLESGEYTIYSITDDNCLDSTTVTVLSIQEPDIILDIQNACDGLALGQVEIQSDLDGLQYSIDGSTFTDTNTIGDLDQGDYILYYKTAEDCIYEIPFEVLLIEEPIISLELQNTCEGSFDGSVTASNTTSNLTFSLDGSSFGNSPLFDQLEAGSYNLWVTNESNCTYEYPFEIFTFPLPTVDVEVDNSCENIDNGSLLISTNNNENLVSINGGSFTGEKSIQGLGQGTYELIVRDANMCETETTVIIEPQPILEVSLDVADQDCYDQEVVLSPEVISSFGDLSYKWSDGSVSSTFTASKSGQYTVTVSDFCDEQQFSVDLEISIFDEKKSLDVPNIFSPNGDNINDCFQALNDINLDLVSFNISIFDRWGNLMFNTNDPEGCWDGIYNDVPVVPGVYVYILNFEFNVCDGTKKISKYGDVTVMR